MAAAAFAAASPLLRLGAGSAAVAGLSALGARAYMDATFGEDALPRMLSCYRRAVPAFLSYKFVDVVHEQLPARLGLPVDGAANARRYEALHREFAPAMLGAFLELRGFFIKSGQMIANNIGDGAPEHWQKVFEPLLQHVPHKDFGVVRATVERELGRPLEEVFSAFAPEPIAAASIGQVHRATLRASGRRVVVKVMYPEVERQFRGDIHTARSFVAVALPEHLPALNEIEKQFANEFDYRVEAAQLRRVGENLRAPAARGRFADVIVPEPVLPLCTKAVLVMSEVENAETLSAALQRDVELFARRRGLSTEQFVAEERALDAAALARGELRCGPDAKTMDGHIAALRAERGALGWLVRLFTGGAAASAGAAAGAAAGAGAGAGAGGGAAGAPSHVPLNHARIVDRIFEVHGHEVLVDGYFNGDPHPGNILVSYRDEAARRRGEARLALVDYGQVKQLSRDQRLRLSRLIVALARSDAVVPALRDRLHVARCLREMGFASVRDDPEHLFAVAQLYFDRDDKLVTGGRHVQQYIEALERRDQAKTVADDYVLVCRASLMLRGLGHVLNQHRRCAVAWRPIAERVMREAGEDPQRESFY
jgi:aarF domain-containing kinase